MFPLFVTIYQYQKEDLLFREVWSTNTNFSIIWISKGLQMKVWFSDPKDLSKRLLSLTYKPQKGLQSCSHAGSQLSFLTILFTLFAPHFELHLKYTIQSHIVLWIQKTFRFCFLRSSLINFFLSCKSCKSDSTITNFCLFVHPSV